LNAHHPPHGNPTLESVLMTVRGDLVEHRRDDDEHGHRDLPVAATTRRLQLCGLSVAEASNLMAHLRGLPAVESGWTVRQIEHLLFLRSIVETHRLKP
jgi:hypothetical protein